MDRQQLRLRVEQSRKDRQVIVRIPASVVKFIEADCEEDMKPSQWIREAIVDKIIAKQTGEYVPSEHRPERAQREATRAVEEAMR